MSMKDTILVILLYLSHVLVRSQLTGDFCEIFNDNEQKVDYGYYNIVGDRFLIIGQNYWTIKGDVWENSSQLLRFKSNISQRNENLFGSEYHLAFETGFCSTIGISKQCKRLTGLLNPDKLSPNTTATIDWVPIDYNYEQDEIVLAEDHRRYVFNQTQIKFREDFKPMFAFSFVGHYICFMHHYLVHPEFRSEYQCFRFDGNTGEAIDVTKAIFESLKYEMKESGIDSKPTILDIYEIVAIFNEFIILREGSKITYCPSHSFFFNLKCTEWPKLLIECPPIAPKQPPKTH